MKQINGAGCTNLTLQQGFEGSTFNDGSEADLSDVIKRLGAHNRFLESELDKRSRQVAELEQELSALKLGKPLGRGSRNGLEGEDKRRNTLLNSEYSEDSMPDDSHNFDHGMYKWTVTAFFKNQQPFDLWRTGLGCAVTDVDKFNNKALQSSDIDENSGLQPFSTRSFGSVSSTATNHTDPGLHTMSPVVHSVERGTKDDGAFLKIIFVCVGEGEGICVCEIVFRDIDIYIFFSQ